MSVLHNHNGRGAPPKVDGAIAAWFMLESSGNSANDIFKNYNLNKPTAITQPGHSTSCPIAGGCRTFAGSHMLEHASDATLRAAVVTNYTAEVWFRLKSTFPGTETVNVLAHGLEGALATENFLFKMEMDLNAVLKFAIETGTKTRTTHNSLFTMPTEEWVLWSVSVEDEGASASTYRQYINGRKVSEHDGEDAPSGGSTGILTMGGVRTSGGTLSEEAYIDVACAVIHDEVRTDAQIRESHSRSLLWPMQTSIYHKVEIDDSVGTPVDFSDLEEENWVNGFTVDGSEEAGHKSASVTLIREVGLKSLSPYKTLSMMNLSNLFDLTSLDEAVDVGRDIQLYAVRMPLGVEPAAGDFQSLFEGEIDDIDVGPDEMQLTCRDKAGNLQDAYIETLDTYTTGTVEARVQDVLGNSDSSVHTGAYAPVTVYTPIPTNGNLTAWAQKRDMVMNVIRMLCAKAGHAIKYRWDHGTEAWRLTIYDPGADRIDCDANIVAGLIMNFGRFAKQRANIRNVYKMSYPDSADLDDNGNPVYATQTVTNTASRDKYGRRTMFVQEPSTTQMDTGAEATTFLTAAESALAEPQAEISAESPNLFELQSSNFVQLEPDNLRFDGITMANIYKMTHTFGMDDRSSYQLRGRPSLGPQFYLSLMARRGGGKPGMLTPDDVLTEAFPGQHKPVVETILQNSQLLQGGKYASVINPNFASFSKGDNYPPDGWSLASGVWGTGIDWETSTVYSGARAVKWIGASSVVMQSQFVPVEGNSLPAYVVESKFHVSGSGAGSQLKFSIHKYDKDKVSISSQSFTTTSKTGAGTWQVREKINITSSTTSFIRIEIEKASPATSGVDVTVDNCSAYRATREVLVTRATAQTSVTTATWTTLQLDTEIHDYGTCWDSSTFELKTPEAGWWDVLVGLEAKAGTTLTSYAIRLQTNIAGGGYTTVLAMDKGALGIANLIQIATQLELNQDDLLRVQGYIVGTGALSFVAGVASTFALVRLIQTE